MTNYFYTSYTSMNKALLIDFAYSVISFSPSGIINSPYDVAKYFIRSTTTELIQPILQNNIGYASAVTATISGSLGGAFKYGLTGQNIFAGILNNIGYELCNNNKLCSTPIGSFIATFILESIDPLLQEILKNGVDNIAEFDYTGSLRAALIIATTIELLYVPNENYVQHMIECDSSQCMLDTTTNAVTATANHIIEVMDIGQILRDEL